MRKVNGTIAASMSKYSNRPEPTERIPYKVGDIVTVNESYMGQPAGVKAYVYGTYSENGIYLISENMTDFGGFSQREQDEHLVFVGHTGVSYSFKNSLRMAEDIRTGFFRKIFQIPHRSLKTTR